MSNCNENYIKEAAYYLWQNAGCPSGQDDKFWTMAVEQYSSCSKTTKSKSCGCKKSCASTSSSTKKTTTKSTRSSSKK